ncbi:FxDxF family PEP-CTERM protein [Pseudoduganella lurida]|nr:FxDxF family PEP-CTERM protein [Pseudoduganella lurida]
MSKVAGSLLLTAGMLAAGAASADTSTLEFKGTSAGFSAQHEYSASSFTDTFLFSIDDSVAQNAYGNALAGFDSKMLFNYGITDIQFFSVGADGSHTDIATTFLPGVFVTFKADSALTAGNYGFSITGRTISGTESGSYGGNLTLAPVPEPATYAMLGVGIGLLAFTARRKSNNKLG